MNFNKRQLDRITNLLGLISLVAGAMTANDLGDRHWTGTIAAISTGLMGWFVQKAATGHPTTQDLEP